MELATSRNYGTIFSFTIYYLLILFQNLLILPKVNASTERSADC